MAVPADNWFTQNMGNDFWNFHNDVRRGYLGGINSMPFVMKPRDVQHPTELNPKSTPQLRKGMYPQSEAAPLGLDTRGLDILALIMGVTRENPGILSQLLGAGNPNVGSPPMITDPVTGKPTLLLPPAVRVDNRERARRAKEILDEPVVKDALREMEERAIEEFITSTRWWWSDRRRRIAAEHIREVRDFKHRLEMMIVLGPTERIKSRV